MSIVLPWELEVGTWVQFSLPGDVGSKEETIYAEDQRYLVIAREDYPVEVCSCCLMNMEGKVFEYSYTLWMLNSTLLSTNATFRKFSKNSVENTHGKEKVQEIFQKGIDHLKSTDRAGCLKASVAYLT